MNNLIELKNNEIEMVCGYGNDVHVKLERDYSFYSYFKKYTYKTLGHLVANLVLGFVTSCFSMSGLATLAFLSNRLSNIIYKS